MIAAKLTETTIEMIYCNELHKQDFFWQNHYLFFDCNLHRVRWYHLLFPVYFEENWRVYCIAFNQCSIHWLWHATVSAEQVQAADKRTAAASRCCGFLARAQSHVQLSGRHCIGFRRGTNVTSLRWTGFLVCVMLTQGRRNTMSKSL